MYIIDKTMNRCIKVEEKKFSELGFRERDHLQEWLAADPTMFGEELLIIQKEFDGFSDTKERLDLLAIDKQGNLVIIENKLDDTGKDVVWQSLKYASYCSSLGKDEVRGIFQNYLNKNGNDESAEQILCDFLEQDYDEIILNKGTSQRIFLVAAKFRKEVTSTVLWLMNYNINIQCFKVTPYQNGEELLLDIEQIIPIKDAQDYTIKVTAKTKEDTITEAQAAYRHNLRYQLWTELIKEMNTKSELFKSISPSKDNWIGIGGGISGVVFNFVVTKNGARVEAYISTSKKEKNKEIYEHLYNRKENIEADFGHNLNWFRMDNKESSKVFAEVEGNYFERENWPIMIKALANCMIKFHKAISGHLLEYKGVGK